MSKKIASLFSGCGGLDLGFTGGFTFRGHEYNRLNTTILFANDFDQDAKTCYNSNPLLSEDGAQCLLADIRDVEAENIRQIQRANALRRKVIKSFRKNTQKEYENSIFLLVED